MTVNKHIISALLIESTDFANKKAYVTPFALYSVKYGAEVLTVSFSSGDVPSNWDNHNRT